MAISSSYQEIITTQSNVAESAALDRLGKLYRELISSRQRADEEIIRFINIAREIGQMLITLFDRSYNTDLSVSYCKHLMPFDLEAAKRFIRIFKKLPEPVGNIAAAAYVFREEFVSRKPSEIVQVSYKPKDPMTYFLNDVVRLKQILLKAYRAKQLDKLSEERLHDFINDTQWLVDEHNRAIELLVKAQSEAA